MEKKYLTDIIYKGYYSDVYNDRELTRLKNATRNTYGKLRDQLHKTIESLEKSSKNAIVKAEEVLSKFELVLRSYKKKKNSEIHWYSLKKEYHAIVSEMKVMYDSMLFNLDDYYSFSLNAKIDIEGIAINVNGNYVRLPNIFDYSKEYIKEKENLPSVISGIDGYTYYLESADGETLNNDDKKAIISRYNNNIDLKFENNKIFVEYEIKETVVYKIKKSTTDSKIRTFKITDESSDDFDKTDYFFDEYNGTYSAITDDNKRIEVTLRGTNKDYSEIKINAKELGDKEVKQFEFRLNLVNLKRQRKALDSTASYPNKFNRPLLDITYNDAIFNNQEKADIKSFKYLTNSERDGAFEQQEFVRKALATNDFMILQGPPGSGKTTTILEFIHQATHDNKDVKILLSASTHVAIDNILERIDEDIVKEVFPIRVGRSDVISESVKRFSYEDMKMKYKESIAEFYLKNSRLVCGTTMGLTSYLPENFNNQFDYLIIDESSKTTLQEFIVPARMAKKYILVGDIKQLSPYTETSFLESILISNEVIDDAKRKANTLALDYTKKNESNVLVIDSEEVLVKLKNMPEMREKANIIREKESNALNKIFENQEKQLFIHRTQFDKYKNFLPSRYQFYAMESNYSYPSSYNTVKIENNVEDEISRLIKMNSVNSEVFDKRWEKEVAWRLVRHSELNKESSYKRDLDLLLNGDAKVFNDIEQIGDQFIPSILQKLQEGIKSSNKFPGVIHNGFTNLQKESRFVMLKYQHRMHETIAKYIEDSIYNRELMTSKEVIKERKELDNLFGSERSYFIDVKSNSISTNHNSDEIKMIIRLVKDVINKLKNSEEKIVIALLCFYRKQETELARELNRLYIEFGITNPKKRSNKIGNLEIELYTVDKYQGKEADITIISMTRNKGLGFMNVPNRVNVAMSRAKHLRIVVGDSKFFDSAKLYHLNSISANSILIKEGKIDDIIKKY